MIAEGRIYKAIPPLYSIKQGKKERYFTEQIDIIKYMQKLFLEEHGISYLDKRPLDNKDITLFFMRNADYVYYIERMANTFALHPRLLEKILFNYISGGDSVDYKKLEKEIKSSYRFMNTVKLNNGMVKVQGVIDKSNVAIINDRFITECRELIDIMKSNEKFYYLVDGNKMSLYEICLLYNKLTPSGIKRYKGLGEMQTQQLVESTLRADKGNRTLIRYTMQDIKEEQELIRQYESDPKKILGLIGTVTRDDLID